MAHIMKLVESLKGTKTEKLAKIKVMGNQGKLEVWEMYDAVKILELLR